MNEALFGNSYLAYSKLQVIKSKYLGELELPWCQYLGSLRRSAIGMTMHDIPLSSGMYLGNIF